jgi:hypothetical protein
VVAAAEKAMLPFCEDTRISAYSIGDDNLLASGNGFDAHGLLGSIELTAFT